MVQTIFFITSLFSLVKLSKALLQHFYSIIVTRSMLHATLWSSVTQSTLQMCYSKGFQLLTSQTACFGSECSFPPIWDYFGLFAYYMIAITLSLWDQRGPQKEHVNPTVNDRVGNYFLKFDCRAANIVSMFSK